MVGFCDSASGWGRGARASRPTSVRGWQGGMGQMDPPEVEAGAEDAESKEDVVEEAPPAGLPRRS